jgi:3-hydroxybutyrate dehydrogenase
MSQFDFSGKRVLVTGGQRGIGYAVAEGFARSGADVTILAELPDVTASAAKLSEATGRPVAGVQCDIADQAQVIATVGGLEPLDILINNAGMGRATPTLEESPDVDDMFRRIIDINVLGTWYVTRAAAPRMRRNGKIVITSSVFGRTAGRSFAAYVTSKHALIGLTRALAIDLAPLSINVNAICPGAVGSEFARSVAIEFAKAAMPELKDKDLSQEEAEAMGTSAHIIHEGFIEPAGIAHTFLFLASDAASDITGQTLNVDRGVYMA